MKTLNHEPALTLEEIDRVRVDATTKLSPTTRSRLGQFFTPSTVASFMASLFRPYPPKMRLLDPGAGVGSLTAAVVSSFQHAKQRPKEVEVVVYEVDRLLVGCVYGVLMRCQDFCESLGIEFSFTVRDEDFIRSATNMLSKDFFGSPRETFTHVITNPPYRKILTDSQERILLSKAGLETSNLYTGFVYLAGKLLNEGGEMVAITPRSFCNGPYFRPFRQVLLDQFAFKRCHVFESRDKAFAEVLQENVIYSLVKHGTKDDVLLSSSEHPADEAHVLRHVPHDEFIDPYDPDIFVRLITDETEKDISNLFNGLDTTLKELDLTVSTGRVVDFRARDLLRKEPAEGTVPLLYPAHMRNGIIKWPVSDFRKHNAIADTPESLSLLIPSGTYVLTKRFTSKEETRRVVAVLLEPRSCPGDRVGIENHLNYFHVAGSGLELDLAKGLTIFLNSTLLDRYFRQFSGHTQVNATDLRNMAYPDANSLRSAGRRAGDLEQLTQKEIDIIAQEEFFKTDQDPLGAGRKIEEAVSALRDLGLPREQQNERSALTLLALLSLTPEQDWSEAGNPLRGITQMMDFFAEAYGKRYAPNTRETVRRQTMHQFVQAGLAIENPDEPGRPTNSPKWCYQVTPEFLETLQQFGTKRWNAAVERLLSQVSALKERYAVEREMNKIPVTLAPGLEINLSPGGQNVLIKQIIDEFCATYTPAGKVIYVGDSADKWGYFDDELLKSIGVQIESHGKMPDVVVYMEDKNWLVLIEAVTSHGPVNPKRHIELKELFSESTAGLVYVSAFPDRKTLNRYLAEIAWETDVWCAENPTHLIHFNGERFLGPYE